MARISHLPDQQAAIIAKPVASGASKAFADRLVCGLFMLGIVVLLFHAWKTANIGPTAQIVGIALIVGAGFLAWLLGVRPSPPAPVELVLLGMGFLSLFRLSQNQYISEATAQKSLSVSLILLFAVVANSALVRRIPIERLMSVCAMVVAVATVPILALENEGIIGALTAGDHRWAYLFRPFDLHHTMTSILFSLGIMLSVYQIVVGKLWVKAAFAFVVVVEVVIVLASGGRTGFLACAISLMLVFITRIRRAPMIVWAGVAILALGSLLFFDLVLASISNLMELDSEYRGWGTGATGRTELWAEGFELLLADPMRLLLGSGLRTTAGEAFNFNPENSYIAIALESGTIMLIAFVTALIATIVRLHYHASDSDKDERLILYGLLPVLQFALIVGIFNRQLLSVGNPSSMIFLVVFAGAWIYVSGPKSVRATVAPQITIQHAPELGSERRRRRAQEQSNVPGRDTPPSSRALMRRSRAQGAHGGIVKTPFKMD